MDDSCIFVCERIFIRNRIIVRNGRTVSIRKGILLFHNSIVVQYLVTSYLEKGTGGEGRDAIVLVIKLIEGVQYVSEWELTFV